MFGRDMSVALQDPAYPVYVDSSVIMGMTGDYNQAHKNFDNITYMRCRPENNFFPDLSQARQHSVKSVKALSKHQMSVKGTETLSIFFLKFLFGPTCRWPLVRCAQQYAGGGKILLEDKCIGKNMHNHSRKGIIIEGRLK